MSRFGPQYGAPPVCESPDLKRIVALRRRPVLSPDDDQSDALIDHVTAYFSRGSVSCQCKQIDPKRPCISRLRLTQAWGLYEIAENQGLLGPINVGDGKTLLGILAPLAMPDCKVALLLCPATNIDQTVLEYRMVAQHFRVPSLVVHGKGQSFRGEFTTLHILSYERLSRPNSTTFLENLRPDTILFDECDALSLQPDGKPSVRTGRVLRCFTDRPETRACAWSGSITDSRLDYAHTAAMTLRERSPVPITPEVVEEWDGALAPSDYPTPPGALAQLCRPGEDVRAGFHRRLVETPGVVTSTTKQVDADLEIMERPTPPIPDEVTKALTELREHWILPGDTPEEQEEVTDALAFYRHAQEIACGFHYRWVFNHGETVSQIEEWLKARKLWRREVRGMRLNPQPHLDSDALIAAAADRGAELGLPAGRLDHVRYTTDGGVHILPAWGSEHRARWLRAKPTVNQGRTPDTEPVRLHPYLAEDAARWAQDYRGIVWYTARAFGEWVAEIGGLPLHCGGPDAGPLIGREDGSRSLVASIKSHGRGRDGLQYSYSDQLIDHLPSSGKKCEQLLGRLHRSGQTAPVVRTWYYAHTEELKKAVDQAVAKAGYAQTTIGNTQKLNLGGVQATDIWSAITAKRNLRRE